MSEEKQIRSVENTDYMSYKPRSCIFFWENDAYFHILEGKRWEAALRANASNNHYDEKMQALLNINTEKNEGNFWRPWWKIDESDKILRLATDKEYKTMLRELIRGEIKLPLETALKKKIQL